jgi:hypothetical protein
MRTHNAATGRDNPAKDAVGHRDTNRAIHAGPNLMVHPEAARFQGMCVVLEVTRGHTSVRTRSDEIFTLIRAANSSKPSMTVKMNYGEKK